MKRVALVLCLLLALAQSQNSGQYTSRLAKICTAPCVPPATPDPQAVVPFENLDNWPLGTVPLAKPLVTTASLSGSKRTQWLVATNFAFTARDRFVANGTVTGATLQLGLQKGSSLVGLAAGDLKVADTDGSLVNLVMPLPEVFFSFPGQVSGWRLIPTDGSVTNVFRTTNSKTISTFLQANGDFVPSFGFGMSFLSLDKAKVTFLEVVYLNLTLYWTLPGMTTTGTGVPPPVTAAPIDPDDTPYGLIIGASIGGVIFLTGLVILIVYLARRAAVAQPAIRLDAPMTDYKTF